MALADLQNMPAQIRQHREALINDRMHDVYLSALKFSDQHGHPEIPDCVPEEGWKAQCFWVGADDGSAAGKRIIASGMKQLTALSKNTNVEGVDATRENTNVGGMDGADPVD